jgi:hypothetical protein
VSFLLELIGEFLVRIVFEIGCGYLGTWFWWGISGGRVRLQYFEKRSMITGATIVIIVSAIVIWWALS